MNICSVWGCYVWGHCDTFLLRLSYVWATFGAFLPTFKVILSGDRTFFPLSMAARILVAIAAPLIVDPQTEADIAKQKVQKRQAESRQRIKRLREENDKVLKENAKLKTDLAMAQMKYDHEVVVAGKDREIAALALRLAQAPPVFLQHNVVGRI